MQRQYAFLEQALRNFLGLNETESKLIIKIIERSRVTVKDVNKLLKQIGSEKSTSRSYQLLTSLEKHELITEDKEASPKTFIATHPRVLLDMIDEKKDNIKKDIFSLEEAQDLFEPETSLFKNIFKKLKNINEIKTELYRLRGEGFEITKILKNGDDIKKLYDRLNDITTIKPVKSDLNAILIDNPKTKEKVLVILDMLISADGNIKITAILQINNNLYEYIKKKEGK